MNRRIAYFLFASILFSCSGTQESEVKRAKPTNSEKSDKNIVVQAKKVDESDLSFSIYSNGKIVSKNNYTMYSPIDGIVLRSELRNGKHVQENSLLLQLRNDELDYSLRKTKASLFNNSLTYKSDSISQSRLNSIDGRQFTDTVLKRLEIESGVAISQIELDELKSKQKKLAIVSPVTGIIYDTKIGNKSVIKEGDELFKIYSTANLKCSFRIMESEIKLIRIGDNIKIVPQAFNGTFQAKISEINPIVDENGTIEIIADILNPNRLYLGMNVDVEVLVNPRRSLWVPKNALVKRSGKDIVFTYESGKAIWNEVKIGVVNGDQVEIKNGLLPGSSVIVSNNNYLSHNSNVVLN